MFQFYAEAQDARDLKLVRELNPELQNFDTWLEHNPGAQQGPHPALVAANCEARSWRPHLVRVLSPRSTPP